MAEFCYECTQGLGVPGHQNDFAGRWNGWPADGKYITVLCEGCGYIQVDFDGKRVGPNPVELQKELNAAWKEMTARTFGELIEVDRLALEIIVGNALKASGHDPAEFDIAIGIDEVKTGTVDWSYSKK